MGHDVLKLLFLICNWYKSRINNYRRIFVCFKINYESSVTKRGRTAICMYKVLLYKAGVLWIGDACASKVKFVGMLLIQAHAILGEFYEICSLKSSREQLCHKIDFEWTRLTVLVCLYGASQKVKQACTASVTCFHAVHQTFGQLTQNALFCFILCLNQNKLKTNISYTGQKRMSIIHTEEWKCLFKSELCCISFQIRSLKCYLVHCQ
jgi:hypothetical protein